MKIKVSDYIVNFLNKNGIDTLFTITGGFAMHLNDSFGNNGSYKIYYQHHEQGCGYSATGYSKTNSKPCIVCTTAGCAATNAITPCLVAHQDSLPILFISGQVKSTESIRYFDSIDGENNNKKMKLRHYAGADSDIISMVTPITKYAHEILNLSELDDVLINAYKNLINGRPGPVWLSIPVDIQGMLIDDKPIPIIQPDMQLVTKNDLSNANKKLEPLYELLMEKKRPLIIAGNGIKLANCVEKFNNFLTKYQIPTVVTILGTDIIETSNPLYSGKIGLIGDRHGNFTLQNCDLLISLGCRMSQGIIGYRSDWFAREAKIVYIDNDQNELEKENLNYELKLNMDLNLFFSAFDLAVDIHTTNGEKKWIDKCNHWKNKWIFEMPQQIQSIISTESTETTDSLINPYHALRRFFDLAPSNKITLCSSGSIVTNVWHMVNIKIKDKFLHSSQGDMGFEIPAAIGAQIAEPEKTVVAILGDGSFQLNIQELQTIVQYKLPIKILLFNNGGYGAIQITQTNFFKTKFGVDESSGLSFPKTEKIAYAYGISYLSLRTNTISNIDNKINQFLSTDGPVILEIFCSIQSRYPRLNAIKNADGTFTNRPFEDMDPFMNRKEFIEEMIVKPV
jgi:acetolactate synthase-1/2/3 large subunit